MSKRRFILLIIFLIIITIITLVIMFFSKPASEIIEDPGDTNFFARFNPFGKNNNQPSDETIEEEIEEKPDIIIENLDIKLRKVSSMPIAGYTVYSKERFKEIPITETSSIEETTEGSTTKPIVKPTPPPTEFAPALRYVARATGQIYQTFADKIEERRFSSTLIPKIYEAYFGNKAESVIMRYLKTDDRTIETFLGILPKENLGADSIDSNEIKGTFLPENITSLSVSSDLLNIFYLIEVEDNVIGIVAGIIGDKKTQVFSSPFTEWLTDWPNPKIITLTTKPASGVLGYMYSIDPVKKNFSRILGNIDGLTTLTSPSGKYVLYGNSLLSLNVYNLISKNTIEVPFKGLPEKCVWGKEDLFIICSIPNFPSGSNYPDIWYRGEISFSDQIWKFNLVDKTTELLVNPSLEPGGEDIDGIKLMLDQGENYLFFVNKKDSYLWKLDLK